MTHKFIPYVEFMEKYNKEYTGRNCEYIGSHKMIPPEKLFTCETCYLEKKKDGFEISLEEQQKHFIRRKLEQKTNMHQFYQNSKL